MNSVLTGPTKKLMEFKKEMTSIYPIKAKTMSFGSLKSIKTLKRRLQWGREGIIYQHDPRHVDVLVKDLGLENGNPVQTPATSDVTEEGEPKPLSQDQHRRYRSQVARCLFLSQDRADVTFIVNELCQTMSNPTQQSLAKLKRLTRYLERERQWGQEFKYGKAAEEVTMFTDSDWAGCKETRKSSSAGVVVLGENALKAYTRKQKIIARSSAEAELYAAALGASELKGIVSLLCALLRESCDLKGRINLPGAPIASPFPYARGARQGSVKGPDMWNQVLDSALREPAARWEPGTVLTDVLRRQNGRHSETWSVA